MWFDCPGDKNICVMKNAKASDFKDEVELAPAPINLNGADSQPFLTDDGQTLYFTSDRDGGILAIYKSMRQGGGWSEPVKFISDPSGVAEVSITADGKEMVFAQLFWRGDGTPGLDIYYSYKR